MMRRIRCWCFDDLPIFGRGRELRSADQELSFDLLCLGKVEEVEAVEVVEAVVAEAVVAEAEGVVVVVTAADNLALFLRRLPKPR